MAYESPSPASRWLRENWARLQDYRWQWVVAAEGQVIASGTDLDTVLAEASGRPLDDLASRSSTARILRSASTGGTPRDRAHRALHRPAGCG